MSSSTPMRLLGFNTGRIRPQTVDGEVVRTGYLKLPAARPWVIGPSGAEGDEVAAHADHLYAFDRRTRILLCSTYPRSDDVAVEPPDA
jgi:hypothetical protein